MLSSFLSTMNFFFEEHQDVFNSDNENTLFLRYLYSQMAEGIQKEFQNTSTTAQTIVQVDMNGVVINSAAGISFADTKAVAKSIGGSIEKLNETTVLVGCGQDQNAKIILFETGTLQEFVIRSKQTNTNFSDAFLSNLSSVIISSEFIEWQYDSSRLVSSIKTKKQDGKIVIYDGLIESSNIYTKIGNTITFINKSLTPIKLYSGSTNYDDFYSHNPVDLSVYGEIFTSPLIQPEESWDFQVKSNDSIDWFVYPTILTGKITIENGINKNDTFIISENDGKKTPFSSRIIEVDYDGNVLNTFAEAYVSSPRKVQVLSNGLLLNT